MNRLLGRRAAFIPFCSKGKDAGREIWDAAPVKGVIDYVNARHGWFSVAYHAGETVQRESFKICDIGRDVTLIGRR